MIINYRTVIAFGQENIDKLTENFDDLLTGPMAAINSAHNLQGFYFGFGQSARSLYGAMVFSLALEILIIKWGLDRDTVFFACFMLFYAVVGIGW